MSRPVSRSPLALLLALVVAVATAVTILGVPVVVLTAPAFTRLAEARLVPARETGLPRTEQLGAAEAVRRFIAEENAPPLPATLRGRPAFDRSAVSHLLDVRRVIVGARDLTIVAAAVLVLAALLGFALRRRRALGIGLVAGAVSLVMLVAGSAIYASADFDAFFAAFHGLFFKAGTWEFPMGALLIQLFPERFWVLAGTSWGLFALALAVAAAVLGGWLWRGKRWAQEG